MYIDVDLWCCVIFRYSARSAQLDQYIQQILKNLDDDHLVIIHIFSRC